MADKIKVKRFADHYWKQSSKIDGWFYARLRGEPEDQRSFLIKANAGVKYKSWLCENISEFFVIDGDLIVNEVVLYKNDYALIEPFVEIFNETKNGMLAICNVHGRVVKARDVFLKILDGSISEDEIKIALEEPWISYLKSRLDKEIDDLKLKLDSILKTGNLFPLKEKLINQLISG